MWASAHSDGGEPFALVLNEESIKNLKEMFPVKHQNIYYHHMTIVSGLIRNQEILNKFVSEIEDQEKITLVWLRADKEIRRERKQSRSRDEADDPKHFDYIDDIYPDVASLEVKSGKILDVDTSQKNVTDVISQILSEID